MEDQDEWICANCTLKNRPGDTKCHNCSISRKIEPGDFQVTVDPKESASTEIKTVQEEGESVYHRVKSFFTKSKAPKRWKCENCTYSNNDVLQQCEMCKEARPSRGFRALLKIPDILARAWRSRTVDLGNDNGQQWHCGNCGYKNHPLLHYCERCLQPNPDSQNVESNGHHHDSSSPPVGDTLVNHITSAYGDSDMSLDLRDQQDDSSPHASAGKKLQLDSRTQFYTGSFTKGKSLSVRQRRNVDENEALDQLKHITKMCRESNSPFVDPDFQPADRSITVDGRKSARRQWKVAKWLRPRQIKDMERNPVPWKVFRTPRPSDIHQGALGNCWFLSALAVMAENPELIEQIIVTKEYSEEGVYQVRLCKNGRWMIVTIDDLFPCNSSNSLVFSQARRKQLWVPLIEKGIAKLFGSYEALHSGTIQEGLSLLTGVACEEIEVGSFDNIDGQLIGDTDFELLWVTLLSYKEAGFLVAAACGSKDGNDDTEDHLYMNKGLMPSHAYSVLDVKMIPTRAEKPLRLIRLRNPWGRFSWNGLWSDTSAIWRDYPQLRHDLMPCGAEEGIFWMQWDDFVRHFYRIVVCKYRPDWLCESIQGDLLPPGRLKVMSLEIFTATEVDFCLYQNSTRGIERLDPWNLWILVVKCQSPDKSGKSGRPIFTSPMSVVFQSSCTSQDSVSCSGWLDPGFYAVIPFSFLSWQNAYEPNDMDNLTGAIRKETEKSREYILSVFSSRPLILDKVGLLPGFSAQAIYLLAKKIGQKSEFTRFAPLYHISIPRICRIAVVENRCNSHITITNDASDSYNITSTRGSLKTTDVVPPNHWQVLWVFSRPVESSAYALSLRMEYKLTPNNPEGKWGAVHTPPYQKHLQEFHQVYPISSL